MSNRSNAGASFPIDHTHLRRYTLDNRALELEVLGLFSAQLPDTFATLSHAHDARLWKLAAHTLKGSARAVGACRLAAAAEAAERADFANPERSLLLDEISIAVDEVLSYIVGLSAAA